MFIETSSLGYNVHCSGSRTLPGILLLHGFLGSGADWQHHAEKLQKRYCCFMPDLPGHGESPAPDPKEDTFETVCRSLSELSATLHPHPLHLVGYSMGGRLALYLALRYPERFRSILLVSSSPGLKAPEAKALRRTSDEKLAADITANFGMFLDKWYNLPLFSPLKNHSLFPSILERRRKNNPAGLAASLRVLGTGNQPSLWNLITENRLPATFFAGEKDLKYVEIGRQMVNLSFCPQMVVFPGCGHTLHTENRPLFLEHLLAFLERVP